MASIKDALEECYEDKLSIIKFIIFAIPLYLCIHFILESNLTAFYITMPLTELLLFGFMLKCTKNVRAAKNFILPSFNIFSVLWDGLKGTVALLPLILITYFIAFFLCGLCVKFIPDETLVKVFSWILSILCSSIVYTGYLLYAKDFKIADAYNLKDISEYCVDIIISVFFMYVKLFFVNLILILPAAYIFWIFGWLTSKIGIFYWCVITIYNLAIMGHYLAQIAYETIVVNENKNKII